MSNLLNHSVAPKDFPASISSIKFELNSFDKYLDPDNTKFDPSHIHHEIEIFLNVEGEKSFWVENKLYKLNVGDVIVALPHEIHLCVFEKACNHKYFCLWIGGENIDALVKSLSRDFVSRHFSFGEQKQQVSDLFFTLKSASENKNDIQTSYALLGILDAIMENSGKNTEHQMPLPTLLVNILKYIDKNFQNIVKVSEIADKFYISIPTLNRLFRQYIHITPHKFVESKKLAYAASLLSTGTSVTYAGETAGFSDSSHFIIKFKEKFGVTPKKFKK